MKGIAFILLSVLMKAWYERLKEKNYPPLIARNIELGGVKVNVRARTEALPEVRIG